MSANPKLSKTLCLAVSTPILPDRVRSVLPLPARPRPLVPLLLELVEAAAAAVVVLASKRFSSASYIENTFLLKFRLVFLLRVKANGSFTLTTDTNTEG